MTTLNRPVKREFSSGLFDRRSLIITLDTDGYLKLREKSSRRVYGISFESLYLLLVRQKRQEEEAQKKKWQRAQGRPAKVGHHEAR
jgi:hypothetical protein